MLYLRDPNLVDRSTADLHNHPDIKPLFPDPMSEGIRYYNKTGIYPINHGMGIKRSVADEHPWAALNLLKAYVQANEITNQRRIEQVEYYVRAGLVDGDSAAALTQSIVKHGIKANRLTLETAAQYSHEQGLTPRLMKLEEVFAKTTMDQ